MRPKHRAQLVGLCIIWFLTGCTLLSTSPNPPVSTLETLHADLKAHTVEAHTAHAIALDLWDRVIQGDLVSCQEIIPVPEPINFSAREIAHYPQIETMQTQLNTAIDALRNAADLWNIECADERPLVPLSMAQAGRSAVLTAGEALTNLQAQLDLWQLEF